MTKNSILDICQGSEYALDSAIFPVHMMDREFFNQIYHELFDDGSMDEETAELQFELIQSCS